MKKSKRVLQSGIKVLATGLPAVAALQMAACAPVANSTFSHKTDKTGAVIKGYAFDVSQLPVKDFEVVKLVFARDIIDETDKTPPINVWHNLLIKAHEAGAHAIINVNIEESKSCHEITGHDHSKNCMTTRYGSALAIKYTETKTGKDNEFKNTVIGGQSINAKFSNTNNAKNLLEEDSVKIENKEKTGEVLRGYSFDVSTLPMKDYEPVKMVFSRAVIEEDMNTPPTMLYHDLLLKASELGAHAVININIEETKFCDDMKYSTGSGYNKCKVMRYGAGLAIKYTDSIIMNWEDSKDMQRTVIEAPADSDKESDSAGAKSENVAEEDKAGGLFGGLFGKGK